MGGGGGRGIKRRGERKIQFSNYLETISLLFMDFIVFFQ
jgi:hypothetical protein